MVTLISQYSKAWMSLQALLRIVKVGDLIEFRRPITRIGALNYGHWAVYIGMDEGEHYAVHMSTGADDFDFGGIQSILLGGSRVHVRCDAVGVIAAGSLCRINNCLDSSVKPLPPQEIRNRAMKSLGNSGYNIFQNNCEHFVKSCRYGGSHESTQAEILASVGLAAGAVVAVSSLPYAAGIGLAGFACLRVKDSIKRRFWPY